MRTYTYALAAAVPMILPFQGKQFYLVNANYPVDVEFFDANNQNAGEKLEAIEAGSWAEPENGFSSIRLASATAQTIKFIISTGRAGVFRVSGNVAVVDGRVARTLAGAAFMGQVATNAVAAQYGHVQLFNPAGSGKRAVVEQIVMSASLADVPQIFRYDTPLTRLFGYAPSKNVGGTVSTMELRAQENATQLATAPIFLLERVAANTTAPPLVLASPIVVRPGYGLECISGIVNSRIDVCFEFYEEADV